MTSEEKKYKNLKIKKLPNSRISIEGEITTEVFMSSYHKAVDRLRANFEAPGFRKGHVPEQIFIDRVNKGHLLEEAAEISLRTAYPQIIADYDLKPLSSPEISITKLAPNNPLGFKAEIVVRPEIKLPDYKKIAKQSFSEEVPIELKEGEVDTFVSQILDMENQIRKKSAKGGEEIPAAELTDDFVKQLGPFENAEDFKNKIREDMINQKKSEAKKLKREDFAMRLIEASSLSLPPEIIEEEFKASMERIMEDLKEANLSLEEYAKKIGKDQEQFKKEKRGQIENQIKLRFLLEDIANREKIVAQEKEVDAEISRIKNNHPETKSDQIRPYVELMLRNEAVLKFLENLS